MQINYVAAEHAGYYVEALMIFNTAGTLIKPHRKRLNHMHNGISGLTNEQEFTGFTSGK
jgi:hypothetical protein